MVNYVDYLEKGKGTSLEVGWHNQEKAKLRYETIAKILNDCESVKILDVGCGTGNLLPYLQSEKIYKGIDPIKEYIDVAIERHGDMFSVNNEYEFYGLYDAIVSVGVYTIKPKDVTNYEYHFEVIKSITHLWSKCFDRLIINGFHTVVDDMDYKFYFDVNMLIDLSQKLKCNLEIKIFEKYEFIAIFSK